MMFGFVRLKHDTAFDSNTIEYAYQNFILIINPVKKRSKHTHTHKHVHSLLAPVRMNKQHIYSYEKKHPRKCVIIWIDIGNRSVFDSNFALIVFASRSHTAWSLLLLSWSYRSPFPFPLSSQSGWWRSSCAQLRSMFSYSVTLFQLNVCHPCGVEMQMA